MDELRPCPACGPSWNNLYVDHLLSPVECQTCGLRCSREVWNALPRHRGSQPVDTTDISEMERQAYAEAEKMFNYWGRVADGDDLLEACMTYANAMPRAPEMRPIAEMPERLRKEVEILLERHDGSRTLGWWAGGWHTQDNDVDIEPDDNFRAYLEIPARSARANNDLKNQDNDPVMDQDDEE